ncbi:MAG: hypothetical protein AAFV53_29660 [Myxococcota bacterium]
MTTSTDSQRVKQGEIHLLGQRHINIVGPSKTNDPTPVQAWLVEGGGVVTFELPEEEPIKIKAETASPSFHAFLQAVTPIEEVICVVLDAGEHNTSHVTTFAENITDEVRDRVYDAEADAHSKQDTTYDFHLREASDLKGAPLEPPENGALFVTWGSLNGGPR